MASEGDRGQIDRGLSTARAVLAVLSFVAESPTGVSARQVAERLHKSRSTAYHLLASLEAEGFVTRIDGSSLYALMADKAGAPRPAAPAPGATHSGLRSALRDAMREAFRRTGHRAAVAELAGGAARMVDQVGRQGIPRMAGLEQPLISESAHALAVGKLALADLSDEALSRYVDRTGLRPRTPLTISDPARLRAELAEVRRRGVATDGGEYDVGFGSVAVSISDRSGRAIAAVGVTVTRVQFGAERDVLVHALLEVTRELRDARAG